MKTKKLILVIFLTFIGAIGAYGIVSYLDTPEELPVLMLSDKSWKKSWLRMQEMRQSRWMSIFSFRKIL